MSERRRVCCLSGISFTPREVGDHFVSVFRNGQPIPGSPFRVVVGQTEIGNASKVKAGGRGLTQGMANQLNEFFINTRDAGGSGRRYSSLTSTIVVPSIPVTLLLTA